MKVRTTDAYNRRSFHALSAVVQPLSHLTWLRSLVPRQGRGVGSSICVSLALRIPTREKIHAWILQTSE